MLAKLILVKTGTTFLALNVRQALMHALSYANIPTSTTNENPRNKLVVDRGS